MEEAEHLGPGDALKALSVDEIRPAELRSLQAQAYERDLERLRLRRNDFVEVPCPACGAHRPAAAFEKHGFAFQRCEACRTLYMSPRPTPEIMGEYYGNSENYRFWADHIFPASEPSRREKIHRPMAEYLLDLCRRHGVGTGGTLLEIGPGFGTFAAVMNEMAYFDKIVCIERTPEMAKACRERGVTVLEKSVEDIDAADGLSADVLVSFEVIEHLFEPAAFIAAAGGLLRPGGLLVLTCPNGEGFDIMTLGADSVAVDSEHVNLFNPSSLAGLLDRLGFAVIDVQTPGRLDAELVRDAVLSGTVEFSQAPFLQRVLVDDWERLGVPFQQFLAQNGLSSHLRVVAVKR